MDSTPKRWVMRPLMPKLEKTDLRGMLSPDSETYSSDKSWNHSQDGNPLEFNFDDISVARVRSSVTVTSTNGDSARDVIVRARQVAVSEEGSTSEDWHQSSPSSPGTPSSTDSRVGFYSFVDDPTSPEAEKNEAYMVSPERQAKLSTLEEKNNFKLQTYTDERKPEKLFEENNGDSRYQIEDTLVEENNGESPDRMEIIRSQAPKTNLVFKEQWSALESLDLRNSPHRLVDGFSLCYSPLSTKPTQSEAEPGTIDDQQIDFNVVRKRFLLMEQSKENPFRHSPQQMPPSPTLRGRSMPAEFGLFPKEVNHDKNMKDEFSQKELPLTKEENTKMTVTVFEDPEESLQISLIDDIDSRFGTTNVDFIRNGGFSNEPSMLDMSNLSVASSSETPIEREIRIAQEREEDLRRSRGIFRPATSEMVEIKTKPILSQSSSELKPVKAKEANRVSFLIQREMDRVSDRGHSSDLDERRKTFSSQSDQGPIKSLRTSSSMSMSATGSSVTVEEPRISQKPVVEEQRDVKDSEEVLSPCCPHRHQDETQLPRSSTVGILDRTARTRLYTKEDATERANDDFRFTNQPFWMAEYKGKESRRTFSSTTSPASPAAPVGIRRSIATRTSYLESLNECPCSLNASDIIRKEIEEDLRREQELQELRETRNLSLSADTGPSEPTTTPLITSEEASEQNEADHTYLSTSLENLIEVDSVVLERSTPRSSYSLSYSQSLDSAPVIYTSVAGPSSRLPSVSIVTPQPWSSHKTSSQAVPRAASILSASPRPEASSTPSQKGLTETLLDDFEERRIRQKLEEGSYAGIQPIDAINNEVVEATRVVRHKSSRALRWEAGVYDNEENN